MLNGIACSLDSFESIFGQQHVADGALADDFFNYGAFPGEDSTSVSDAPSGDAPSPAVNATYSMWEIPHVAAAEPAYIHNPATVSTNILALSGVAPAAVSSINAQAVCHDAGSSNHVIAYTQMVQQAIGVPGTNNTGAPTPSAVYQPATAVSSSFVQPRRLPFRAQFSTPSVQRPVAPAPQDPFFGFPTTKEAALFEAFFAAGGINNPEFQRLLAPDVALLPDSSPTLSPATGAESSSSTPPTVTPKSSPNKRKRDVTEEGEELLEASLSLSLEKEEEGKTLTKVERAWTACVPCRIAKRRCVKLDLDDKSEVCKLCVKYGKDCIHPSQARVHPSQLKPQERAAARARAKAKEEARVAKRLAEGKPATAPKRKSKKFVMAYKSPPRKSHKGKGKEVESSPSNSILSLSSSFRSASPIPDLPDMPAMTVGEEEAAFADLLAACSESCGNDHSPERFYYEGEAEAGSSGSGSQAASV
ncbi:hypothetical protein IAR50_005275 [Cryptococcus sp. DSM 104548]